MVLNIRQTALLVERIKTALNTIHAVMSTLVGAATQTHIASVMQAYVSTSVSMFCTSRSFEFIYLHSKLFFSSHRAHEITVCVDKKV